MATKKAYVKTLSGKYIGVDPSPVAGKEGDEQFPVYADRPSGGAWEETTITDRGGANGDVDVKFNAANRQLTLTPDGYFQSRPAGAVGAWETLRATKQPDGTVFLYRYEDSVLLGPFVVLEIV